MPALFISYRRSDSSDITGRIFDRLVGHFHNKPVKVVRDVDSIPVGDDFREVLRDRIQDCDVVLVIIGPTWITVKDGKGTRRLDDASDTVRIEIEQALQLKKKVIPVCVTHTTMPTEDDLPGTLKKLAFRNGVQVRPDPDFNNDISRLISALERIFKDKQIAEAKPPTLPPPQRHFQLPEPPPPPMVETRRTSGSYGSSPGSSAGGSPFAVKPPEPPIPAQAVQTAPESPQRNTDSSPRPRPGNANYTPNLHRANSPAPPPSPNAPVVRPLPSTKPSTSLSLLTSSTSVAVILTVLVSFCMCGGLFSYLVMSMAGQGYERQLQTDIQNNSIVLEHVGEIISVDWDFAASGVNDDKFQVKGTKGTAMVIGHTDSSSHQMVGDTLRLPDGTEYSLHSSK
ncbi:MAG: toll/interleukin-1 receptor domain-containing protein [Planctomycetales bacterium]|nr:toll/interleukin-1 receptor domain-containing protein [Planctomycetales bacterium]